MFLFNYYSSKVLFICMQGLLLLKKKPSTPLELDATKLHHRTFCLIASFPYDALCQNCVVQVTKELQPKGEVETLHHGSAALHVGLPPCGEVPDVGQQILLNFTTTVHYNFGIVSLVAISYV